MKKRLISILIIIIIIGFYTHYIDSARVRNGVEPKYTLKIINEKGNKVTYWGLGYKVILYPKVSPNEPYKNNRGVKYGSWLMEFELNDESQIIEIVDTTNNIKDFDCAESLEKFYEDNNYVYYYNCIKSSYVLVKYENGSQITAEEALKNGDISIKDLDAYKIVYIKSKK